MKTKQQKQESFSRIKAKLAKSRIAILTSFSPASTSQGGQAGGKGLNVGNMKELRKTLRPLDAEYTVEKKTIFDRAAHQNFPGSLGVAYSYGDPFAVAKALWQFAKKHSALKLFGALMGSEFVDEARLVEWAKLPAKEVLISRLVGMLSYPMRSLAVVLNQIKHE